MWDFKWEKQMSALTKIQRSIKSWIFLCRLKNNQLRVLREFKFCFKERNVIPYDILMEIIGINTNKQDFHHQYPMTRVETKSFKKKKSLANDD